MSDVNISAVYDAINPMPAMLSARGKVRPEVRLMIEANANVCLHFSWIKDDSASGWDRHSECFFGKTVTDAVIKASSFIADMPDAQTARRHKFMGQLGKLIDDGREVGIEVAYLNPLVETMKRLSENAITHQPSNVVQIVGAPQFDGAA